MLKFATCGLLLAAVSCLAADDPLAIQLKNLESRVIVVGTVRQPPLAAMLARHSEARLRMANRADTEAWQKVRSLADWEQFRQPRWEALRKSLANFPASPDKVAVKVTGSHSGAGFQVQNLVYVTRPGLVVTANLYLPLKTAESRPGIILCHSHQSTKHSGARQDMAMTWARAGCVVLVPDHLGHGERRQHLFGAEGGHDYHFRYDLGMQLQLAGESLMGWLVWDLMRGVDVLLAQANVDPQRIVLISEPAGGGDVAAVTAALDQRINCAMVQNFGGPQPETAFPLTADAEESFALSGTGSWESTRNLRLSARDGFLPWSIVAAIAPRRLIYFHEFYWDREQDPAWQRLQQIYRWHERSDSLVGLAGRGFVVGSAPENTHWLPENRALLYPVLERWLQIPNPQQEYSQRMPEADLQCLTPELSRELGARPAHALVQQLVTERLAAARKARATLSPAAQRTALQREWRELLGSVDPRAEPLLMGEPLPLENFGGVTLERLHLRTEPGIVVPVLLLKPNQSSSRKCPLVLGVSQRGKAAFLQERARVIAELLRSGVAVALLDIRGTGETSSGEDRGRRSSLTSISASELMLGQTVLGGQLHDVCAVLQYLRSREGQGFGRVALWGESFTPVNPADVRYELPHTAGDRPPPLEPLGGWLALLTALLEEDVSVVYAHRGLADVQSVLASPFCYLPHDALVPGMLAHGDLPDLAVGLQRKIWLHEPVDALGRAITEQNDRPAAATVQITMEPATARAIAQWLSDALQK